MVFNRRQFKPIDLIRHFKLFIGTPTTLRPPSPSPPASRAMATSKPVVERTHYTSQPVDIPGSFLTTPPSAPITLQRISFADSPLPEYAGCFAVLLDNVLAPWECAKLLQLAEASVPDVEEGASPWRPALVNMGGGYEAAVTDYRNSDRIIWDSQTVVDRVWQRCLQARGEGEESMGEMLSGTPEGREAKKQNRTWGGEWKFERLNERMRFLKYTKGQFFKRKSLAVDPVLNRC